MMNPETGNPQRRAGGRFTWLRPVFPGIRQKAHSPGAAVTALLACGAIMLALTLPWTALAQETRGQAMGENIVIGADRVIDDDAFLAGRLVQMRGTVTGDLFEAGDSIETSGKVAGDAILMGRMLRAGGNVDGDIRACGQYITIDGVNGGNLSAAGQGVTIDRSAEIGRNIQVAGDTVDILGNINGRARIGARRVTVVGSVGRDLIVESDELTIGSTARIGGNVTFRGPRPPSIEDGASIGGEVQHMPPPARKAVTPAAKTFRYFLGLVKFVALGLLIALFAAKGIETMIETVHRRGIASFATGVVSAFVVPLLLLILSVIVIGASTAWVLATGYAALFMFAISFFKVFMAFLVGGPLAKRILGREDVPLVYTASIGTVVIYLVTLIPYVDLLVGAVGVFLALGSALILLKDAAFSWPFAGRTA